MLRSFLKEREAETEQEKEKETEKRTTQMKRKNRDREGEHDMHMHILSECQICLPNYKILLSCSVKSQPVLLQVPSFKSWIHFQVLGPS